MTAQDATSGADGDDTEASAPPQPTKQGDGTPGPAPRTVTDAPDHTGTFATPEPDGDAEAPPTPRERPPNRIQMAWAGEHRFDVGRTGAPTVRVDASGRTGPGPVDVLLGAIATCVSVDVVDILRKRRTPIASLEVEAIGERAVAVPARLTRVELRFRISGEGIQRVHAERAIDLAVNKYCSVRNSLDPEMPVEWQLELSAG